MIGDHYAPLPWPPSFSSMARGMGGGHGGEDLRFDARVRELPGSFILWAGWAAVFTPYAEKARALGWPVREIPADHEALATAPDVLTAALLETVTQKVGQP
jgi:hypothetical protein